MSDSGHTSPNLVPRIPHHLFNLQLMFSRSVPPSSFHCGYPFIHPFIHPSILSSLNVQCQAGARSGDTTGTHTESALLEFTAQHRRHEEYPNKQHSLCKSPKNGQYFLTGSELVSL